MANGDSAVLSPNLGLFLGIPPAAVPRRGLQDGLNFRVNNGKLDGRNLGWGDFSATQPLVGEPVVMFDTFQPLGGSANLIIGTTTDIYRYDVGTDSVVYLTPREESGTVSATGVTTVTGSGTLWQTNGVRAGDQIHFGNTGETDPSATWYEITAVNSDTELEVGGADVSSEPTGAYTIRRLFQGTIEDGWQAVTFLNDAVSGDDQWIATNGVDDVISWNGTADQITEQTGIGFTVDALAVFENMVIYGNIGSDITSIANSDVGKPFVAGSAGAGLADQFLVHSGSDEIMKMAPLGDNLVLYSEKHITLAQFVGTPFVFVFRQVTDDLGAVGPNAVANFDDYHLFLSVDSQYIFDGAAPRLRSSHVWRELMRDAEPLRKKRVFHGFDDKNGDLIWSVPLSTDAAAGSINGQAEVAYVEHFLEDMSGENIDAPHSKRDFPFLAVGEFVEDEAKTWDDMSQTWDSTSLSWDDQSFASEFPKVLAGDKDGNVWQLNETQTAGGADLPSFVRFGRLATGTGRARNLLARAYPWTEEGVGTMQVDVFMMDHAGASPSTPTASFDFDLSQNEGEHFVSPFRAGRFVDLQFGAEGDAWVMQGYDLDIRRGGHR